MNANDWLLHGRHVHIEDATRISCDYRPDAKHGLLLKKVFAKLNGPVSVLPTTVTVDDLPWPIKAIVVPNEGRTPYWAVHVKDWHIGVPVDKKLSPFIGDHDRSRPMTKKLTLEIVGTLDHPLLRSVHAGGFIPPLPWQLSENADEASMQLSLEFWRTHSYVYDSRLLLTRAQSNPPEWYVHSTSTLSPR